MKFYQKTIENYIFTFISVKVQFNYIDKYYLAFQTIIKVSKFRFEKQYFVILCTID